MKFHVLFIFCFAVSPTIAFINDLQTIIPNAKLAFKVVGVGIKAVKGVASQKLQCYQCTNHDENGQCAQGDAAQQCEMRSLLRRFGGYLKAKFLGRPNVVPVCLRAEIQVGENLVTRHSCAMVNEVDTLDEATCTSSLYMLGGVSGNIQSCEMCMTDRCNTHKQSTSRARQPWEPYVGEASALVRSMELGHVQHDVQSIQYNSNNASPLVASISLLISTVLLLCID